MPGHVFTPFVDATLRGKISEKNSTSANLGNGGIFQGTAEDTIDYASILVTVHPDQDSAPDGLEIQFSPDGSHWDSTDVFSIFADDKKIFTFMPVNRYFRLKYTNGTTPTTQLHIQVTLKQTATKPSSHRVEESISSEDDAELVKAVLTGQTPFGDYETVQVNYGNSLNIAFGDSANLDAFSRLRVSNPDTVFDSTFQYDLQPLTYQTVTANGGGVAHVPAEVCARLSTAALANSSALIQSKAYHRYIPAKAQMVVMTQVIKAPVVGVTKQFGYFDDNDGIFFQQEGDGTLSIVRRTSVSGVVTDYPVPQDDWNLDTMDGLGRSGIEFDPEMGCILILELQWLGMGRVRASFDIDGKIYPFHQFLNANNLSTVYMRTANLPIRWKISGDAVASMDGVCASVQSEGGSDKFLSYQQAYTRAVVSAANGSQTYAFSIRPKATFNAITNRMLLRPVSFHLAVTGNSPVLLEVYYGTTVGGAPAWTDMDTTYSALQVDTAGTPSGGVRVESFVVGSAAAAKGSDTRTFGARYPLTLDVAGTGYNNMTVYVTGLGGASNCYPGVVWEEVR